MSDITICIIDITWGSPEPQVFNEVLSHIGGNTQDIKFTWSGAIPTHYLVFKGDISKIGYSEEDMSLIIKRAMELTDHLLNEEIGGEIYTCPEGSLFHKINLDVNEGEAVFTLAKSPDTWIRSIWCN